MDLFGIKSNDKIVISDTIQMNSKNTTLHLFANDKLPIYLAEINWSMSERAYFICISNNNFKIINKVYEQIISKYSTQELSKRSDKIGRFQRFENIFYLIPDDCVSQKQNDPRDALRSIVIPENQKVSEQSIVKQIESFFMNATAFIGFALVFYILINAFLQTEPKVKISNVNITTSEEYLKQDENVSKTKETIKNHIPQVNNPITDLKVLIQNHIANTGGENSGDYIEFKNDLAEIIIYTVFAGGEGNHYEQFMIAKVDDVVYQPIYIGGKGVFMADTIRYEGTEIIINGMANKEDDAWGFPTLPYIKRFAIKNSIISEQ